MRLNNGLHLAYCTNIHRGETWAEIFAALKQHTLAVRDRVGSGQPYAIGLRLSAQAAKELQDAETRALFRRWLDAENCYVFTINGFPYGRFHGTRVKEQVYAPDWTTTERVEYTNALFNLLAELVPPGGQGSVSTVPCSFKEFITRPEQVLQMRANLWRCVEHIAGLSEQTGRDLHLGLEPEPLCFLETSHETVCFLDDVKADRPGDDRAARHLGVNYDTCHLAVEYEDPRDVLRRFRDHGVRISKLHFSSAMKVIPDESRREALKPFVDAVYFHQVIERSPRGALRRFRDLDVALAAGSTPEPGTEWRIHFHVPLHYQGGALFESTADHLLAVMDALAAEPGLCSHVEMETYTWEVMPPELKNRNVVDQVCAEYDWTLRQLAQRGIHRQ